MNVAVQSADPRSTLTFYQRLLHLRRALPALHNGSIAFLDNLPDEVLAYMRAAAEECLLVMINFGAQVREIELSHLAANVETLLSSHAVTHDGSVVTLQPHESVLLRLLAA